MNYSSDRKEREYVACDLVFKSQAPEFSNMPLVYVMLKALLWHINNSVRFLPEK